MSSNKEIVRAFVEATNNRDWRKLDSLVSVDFVRHGGAVSVDSREQLIQFHQDELRTFPDICETILLLVEEGDYVAARLNFRGTQQGPMGPFPASGRVLDADFNCIFRVEGGELKESWVSYDNLDGLIQLGHYSFPVGE